jgi:2-polyprenyl-6-hydroxyphenyl methylase/3-demethylubiquinone-9 3-methyltransferase
MCPRAKTDELASISSPEFEWSQAGTSESHLYLTGPTVELLNRFGAKNVLDLGCGNGAFTGVLAAKGFAMAGCDASASGLAIAQASFPGINFYQHDLAFPLPESVQGQYDAVVSLEVVEHLLLPRLLITNAIQALRPGGLLILSAPYHGYWKNLALALTNRFDEHWHPLRDFGHVKFFSKRTLIQLVTESGLEVQAFYPLGRTRLMPCSMIVAARKK